MIMLKKHLSIVLIITLFLAFSTINPTQIYASGNITQSNSSLIKISKANDLIDSTNDFQTIHLFPKKDKIELKFDDDVRVRIAPIPEFKENTILLMDTNDNIINVLEFKKIDVVTHKVTSITNSTIITHDNFLVIDQLETSEYIMTSHPTYNSYAGKLSKAEAIQVRSKLKTYKNQYDLVAFGMGLLYAGWGVVGLFGSSQFDNLINKYTHAIDNVTNSKPYIAVYNVMVWRNGGSNSAYICRDQILKNVS